MSEDIVKWLRAQIAAKRARAEAASPGPWHPNAEHDEVLAVDGITVCEGFALGNNQLRATVDHIVDNDPAAALAQCEAHAALIDTGSKLCDCEDADDPPTHPETREPIPHHYDCPAYYAAQIIAPAYAHNPGYQERWRP